MNCHSLKRRELSRGRDGRRIASFQLAKLFQIRARTLGAYGLKCKLPKLDQPAGVSSDTSFLKRYRLDANNCNFDLMPLRRQLPYLRGFWCLSLAKDRHDEDPRTYYRPLLPTY